MIPTPTLTTTSSTQGLVLDEKKEIDTSDDERLRTTPRSKDWTTMSTSSTMEPSLDGQPPPRRGSSKDEEDPADVSTRIDTGDYDYDDDSQPPSLAPLDNIHSVSRQDLLSTPTPPPPPSPPPPSSSSPLQRPLWKPVQDPHEEQETNPLLDVMIRTVSSLDMDEEPAAHIHAAAHAPRPASSTVHGTTTTTTTIASHATTTTTIMRTPDQQPLKSPPVLFKTANVDWHLPSHEQDQAVILPRNLSLTPPPLPLPTTRQWEEEEGEEFEENEPTMKPLPTHHRTSMTLPDASEEVRYEPLTPFTASTTSAADELRQQQQQQQSWNQDDEDDDKNRVFGKPKGVGGRHIPKPATLRSISVPVHVLSREDEMKTSHFSSNNNNYHGNDGDHDEPPDTEGTSFVRTWEDRQSPVTLVEERPERALRSVSDIPRSTSMSDWTKYLVNDDQQVKGITDISQWLDQGDVKSAEPRRPLFRQMTPKQDFKLSEKSAAWLQEEFKRRSTIKKEINAAILARSDLRKEGHEITSGDSCLTETTAPAQSIVADAPDDSEEAFATALSNALKALPTSPLSADVAVAAEFSHHSEDDEVAALTTFNNTLKSLKEGLQTIRSEEDDASIPRRLDYESAHGRPLSSGVPSVLSDSPSAPQFGTIDFRQDMLRFANETRNVLHGGNLSSRKSEEEPDPQFRSLAVSLAHGEVEEESTIDVTGVITGSLHRSTISAITDDGSNGSPFDISTTPPLVESLDSYLGISKGDITLSLLNEDNTTSAKSTWANRVRVAIWRARRMRRSSGVLSSVAPSSRGRLSIPAAVGRSRAVGGVRSVQASQESAQFHLMNDEIDEALELFETIIFAYYGYFERSLKAREADPGGHHEDTDFRSFIGAALHNLGILNLLKGEYNQALSYFGRAVENRKGCLGESHSDHVVSERLRKADERADFFQFFSVNLIHMYFIHFMFQASLVKLATCHYAVNEFAEAHAKFEIALEYARNDSKGITDRMQMAEILNNLGCLAYMCGQPSAASAFYRESMDVQFNLMGQSLYLCSADVGQSISLNLSITRANIGFIKLVTNALPVAVTALENALMVSRYLELSSSLQSVLLANHCFHRSNNFF